MSDPFTHYFITATNAHVVLVGGWWTAQTLAILDFWSASL